MSDAASNTQPPKSISLGFEEGRDKERSEWTLKQYDTLMRYLAYENQAFWTRSQLFAALQVALIALLCALLVGTSNPSNAVSPLRSMAQVIAIFGIVVSVVWLCVISSANDWINRWRERLEKLEPAAFGTLPILREVHSRGALRFSAHLLAGAFGALWVLLFVGLCMRWI